jgi:integrase
MKGASQFPVLLESFFMDRLMRQRQASPHTIASYRDTFRLLMQYAQHRLRKAPSQLTVPDMDTPFLGAFLDHLEKERDNSARSRNVRLAALHSFFRFVALHAPEYNALAQRVLACQVNGTYVDQSAFSRRSKSRPCSVRRTSAPGAEDVIEPYCYWPCRPDCARQNSPACAVRTLS